jgi:hypothetical protein
MTGLGAFAARQSNDISHCVCRKFRRRAKSRAHALNIERIPTTGVDKSQLRELCGFRVSALRLRRVCNFSVQCFRCADRRATALLAHFTAQAGISGSSIARAADEDWTASFVCLSRI